MNAVTVIDIVAQVTDLTERGANNAIGNLSRLEKASIKMQTVLEQINKKSKIEIAATLKDMASAGLGSVTKE